MCSVDRCVHAGLGAYRAFSSGVLYLRRLLSFFFFRSHICIAVWTMRTGECAIQPARGTVARAARCNGLKWSFETNDRNDTDAQHSHAKSIANILKAWRLCTCACLLKHSLVVCTSRKDCTQGWASHAHTHTPGRSHRGTCARVEYLTYWADLISLLPENASSLAAAAGQRWPAAHNDGVRIYTAKNHEIEIGCWLGAIRLFYSFRIYRNLICSMCRSFAAAIDETGNDTHTHTSRKTMIECHTWEKQIYTHGYEVCIRSHDIIALGRW